MDYSLDKVWDVHVLADVVGFIDQLIMVGLTMMSNSFTGLAQQTWVKEPGQCKPQFFCTDLLDHIDVMLDVHLIISLDLFSDDKA
jgi:hypothetical protein